LAILRKPPQVVQPTDAPRNRSISCGGVRQEDVIAPPGENAERRSGGEVIRALRQLLRVEEHSVTSCVECFLSLGDFLVIAEGPGADRLHGIKQGSAELGQFVVDSGRNGRRHRSGHEAVAL
jgi:hypothetical protein